MTNRYFRCQNDACRRKWHHTSVAYKPVVTRTDLFTSSVSKPVPGKGGCPSCGGAMAPETGTFEELFLGG